VADYTVAFGMVGAHAKTLSPDVVDTVTFALGNPGTPGWGNAPKQVEVLTDGVSDLYVTVDGSTPTVGGSNCFRLPAAGGLLVLAANPDGGSPVVVQLVSDGAVTYSVSRA
jgi:hypothetical protein